MSLAESSFQIKYEDDELAVVAKAPGVVVHPGGGTQAPTLVEELAKVMSLAPLGGPGRPGIVHRLDKDTSGLMLVAKTDAALTALVDAMKSRSISRSYLTLAAGAFRMPSGRIEAPIQRSTKSPGKMAVAAAGKAATTEFLVLEDLVQVSYLRVKLFTGRTHQIRVHLAHIRHPVVGDPAYGKATARLAAELGLSRVFLHSASLVFPHPASGREVALNEPLPADLQAALDKARALVKLPA